MADFPTSIFRGFASVFSPRPAPRSTPRPGDAAAARPPDAAAGGFWAGLARIGLSVALTPKGKGRRTRALRRALGFGGMGALALGLVFGGIGAQPARAEGPAICAEREKVVDRLQKKFGESRRGLGLLQGQRVVEVWRSAETGSWTIVVTLPDGSTCLLAAGENWEDLQEAEPVKGRGA